MPAKIVTFVGEANILFYFSHCRLLIDDKQSASISLVNRMDKCSFIKSLYTTIDATINKHNTNQHGVVVIHIKLVLKNICVINNSYTIMYWIATLLN